MTRAVVLSASMIWAVKCSLRSAEFIRPTAYTRDQCLDVRTGPDLVCIASRFVFRSAFPRPIVRGLHLSCNGRISGGNARSLDWHGSSPTRSRFPFILKSVERLGLRFSHRFGCPYWGTRCGVPAKTIGARRWGTSGLTQKPQSVPKRESRLSRCTAALTVSLPNVLPRR